MKRRLKQLVEIIRPRKVRVGDPVLWMAKIPPIPGVIIKADPGDPSVTFEASDPLGRRYSSVRASRDGLRDVEGRLWLIGEQSIGRTGVTVTPDPAVIKGSRR